MSSTTDHFYTHLPLHEMPASEIFAHEAYFHQIPKDWHVIVTDIEGSTKAVNKGQQQLVNLIATGSIIAALNIGRLKGISLPFFFGGDGASLLVPPSILEEVMQALIEHRANTSSNYDLNLRVGQVPLLQVYEAGHQLLLAKTCLGKKFAVPIVLGNGLKFAESTIKAQQFKTPENATEESTLDLEGMECRWELIKPPTGTPEVVCLLVEVQDAQQQAVIFKKVLEKIDTIYGPQEVRNPISIPKLKLEASIARLANEMRIKLGRYQLAYLLKNFFYTFFAFVYFRFKQSGKDYMQQLVELSDTLVLDGRINTVISGTIQQRTTLTAELEKMEQAGALFFGYHVSGESVMSCYVRNREDEHIHFVDGSQGGYTQAAKMLKRKLKHTKS